MNSFTQREREKKSRSAAEIASDVYDTLKTDKVHRLIKYTADRKDVFKIKGDYDHVFFTPLIDVRGYSRNIVQNKKPNIRDQALKLLGKIKEISYESHWDKDKKKIAYKEHSDTEPFYGIVLFKEQLEQGFRDNKITEEERKEGHKLAAGVQEIFNKLKLLGEELEIAIGKSTTTITR